MTHFLQLNLPTLAFWSPGPAEMLVILVVALLLYGGNLPEIARTWGKTFAEFRRGLTGIQRDFNEAMYCEPEQLTYRSPGDRGPLEQETPANTSEEPSRKEPSRRQGPTD